MANFDYDAVNPTERGAGGVSGRSGAYVLINWMAGATSIALVAGLGYWGYTLMVRDVTGVPVVRALEGPMRVAPEDPGGVLARHQGLSVNEVPGEGIAGTLPDEITLAPDATDLAEEDRPASDLAEETAMDEPESAADEDAPKDSTQAVRDQPDDALATDIAVAEALAGAGSDPEDRARALADVVASDVPPLSAADESGAGGEGEVVTPVSDQAGDSDPGVVARSPRPMIRPSDIMDNRVAASLSLNGETAVEEATIQPLSASVEVSADSLTAGTRLVQLGAFDSPEVARAQWDRISGRFDAYFDGKKRVIQEAESGGRTFYRLRAHGFDDLSDARRFCTALINGQAECIPVVVK